MRRVRGISQRCAQTSPGHLTLQKNRVINVDISSLQVYKNRNEWSKSVLVMALVVASAYFIMDIPATDKSIGSDI